LSEIELDINNKILQVGIIFGLVLGIGLGVIVGEYRSEGRLTYLVEQSASQSKPFAIGYDYYSVEKLPSNPMDYNLNITDIGNWSINDSKK